MNKFESMIRNYLLSLPFAEEVQAKTRIVTKCPCGDGKNYNSKHLFIKLDGIKDGAPITYKCFICGKKGVVNSTFLKELGCFDLNLLMNLNSYNKACFKNGNFVHYSNNIINRNIIISNEYYDRYDDFKIEYLENRLGITIEKEDIIKYKIVTSLFSLAKFNNIKEYGTNNERLLDSLDRDYIGFLSTDRSYITFRQVNSDTFCDKRYYNYKLIETENMSKRYILADKPLDVLGRDKITVNLCEGCIDAIGIYNHIFNKELDNGLLLAVCGGDYIESIKYLLRLGFIDIKINIFADNDKFNPLSKFKKLKKEIRNLYTGNIDVYFNEIEKDWGVTKDLIKYNKYTI